MWKEVEGWCGGVVTEVGAVSAKIHEYEGDSGKGLSWLPLWVCDGEEARQAAHPGKDWKMKEVDIKVMDMKVIGSLKKSGYVDEVTRSRMEALDII